MSERTYMQDAPRMKRDDFILYVTMRFGEENVKRVEDTIEPCDCGSRFCKGWKISPEVVPGVKA